MARFTIYSPTGTAIYTGTPTFTGQYMKPGFLEFRDVALPAYVELVPGCYVDYTRVTDSLGGSDVARRYKVYTAPQLKKQARSYSYGAAYLYQSVQLYDASKMLEYCPFRDLVAGDNRIHFSTQPSISTFEGCDGLARRFEACLQDQYGADSWVVRVATQEENPALYELMREPRNFTVSGLNILECLNKVYEIWPEVGWIYKVEMVNGLPVDTIIIGGGGLNPNLGTNAYGKGNGLISLTRTAANAEEIANRIYAYGSSRNMTLPSWYRDKNIKNAESVDIQNIMLPILPVGTPGTPDYWDGWGLTDGQRDPAKAYVEDDNSIRKNGLRPSTVYFDGKGEYPEIYPTIREATIGMVRAALGSSSAQYYPRTDVYPNDSTRVDKILSAQSTFDSGLAGNAPGKANVEMGDTPFSASGSFEMLAGLTYYPFYHYQGTWTPETVGVQTIAWKLDLSGQVQLDGIEKVVVSVKVKDPSYQGPVILSDEYELTPDASGIVVFSGKEMVADKVNVSSVAYFVNVDIAVYMTAQPTDKTGTYTANGNVGFALQNYRKKTFTISLRQVGFDIGERADLGNGKTIAMRSGDCVGRSFAIKSVQYNSSADCWDLECWRTEDESLSQWFPNSQFKVRGLENAGQSNEYPGDEFVLLDIAMPDIYIGMASERLLTAAQELLADTAVERWQYTPEIDAKFMVENNRSIRAGEYMTILDIVAGDITPGIVSYFKTSGGGYLLTANGERIVVGENEGSVVTVFVDTVVINEGESVIPTYKVTLRDRKKKTWTESQSPESPSSKSVGSMESSTQQSSSGSGDSYFMLDESGNVTLKSQYQNLWVPGWLAAGGIGDGSGGGGGGGGTDLSAVWASLTKTPPLDQFANTKIHIDHIPLSDLDNWVSQKGYLTISDLPDSYFTLDGNGNVTLKAPYQNFWVPGWMAAGGVGSGSGGGGGTDLATVWASLTNSVADQYATTKIDIAHIPDITTSKITDLTTWLASAETDPTVPSWAKQTNPSFYIGTTQVLTSPTDQALTGILSINATSLVDSASRIVWEPNAGGPGVGAWHFFGNLYADGWVASGGVGSGGGSYSPGDGIDITNNVISLQTASTSVLGGVKVDGTTITISNGVISAVGGGGSVMVVDDLTTSSPTSALSANQGKTLKSIIDAGYVFKGFLDPLDDSTPTCDYPVCYISGKSGVYQGYGNLNVSLSNGELALIYRAKNSSSWNYKKTQISVPSGGGGGISSVSLTSGTTNGTLRLTVDGVTGSNVSVYGLGSLAYKSSLVASDIPDISGTYVTLATDQNNISGAKTFTKPLTVNASVGQSYIDIGNARLVFDSGTNALHITKKSGTSATIGLYADGFVASGAIGGQTTSSYVDLESNQIIGGDKTFSDDISVSGAASFSGNLSVNGVTITGSSTKLSINKNTEFSGITGVTGGKVSIQNIIDRIIALES